MDSHGRLIEQFLRTHPGSFCVECLASALGLPAAQVSMARHQIALAGDFHWVRATCSGCRHTRIVIEAA
jgi:hypothetical protein